MGGALAYLIIPPSISKSRGGVKFGICYKYSLFLVQFDWDGEIKSSLPFLASCAKSTILQIEKELTANGQLPLLIVKKIDR